MTTTSTSTSTTTTATATATSASSATPSQAPLSISRLRTSSRLACQPGRMLSTQPARRSHGTSGDSDSRLAGSISRVICAPLRSRSGVAGNGTSVVLCTVLNSCQVTDNHWQFAQTLPAGSTLWPRSSSGPSSRVGACSPSRSISQPGGHSIRAR
ncbi:hypothetical protein ET532_001965 [Verminephrobacter sp. Larva24]|nr:hypothetical protein ET532_001965 [Verminephrobacter sp. Larva24]